MNSATHTPADHGRNVIKTEPVSLTLRLVIALLLVADVCLTVAFYAFGYWHDMNEYFETISRKSELVSFATNIVPSLIMVITIAVPIVLAAFLRHCWKGKIETFEEVD